MCVYSEQDFYYPCFTYSHPQDCFQSKALGFHGNIIQVLLK